MNITKIIYHLTHFFPQILETHWKQVAQGLQ